MKILSPIDKPEEVAPLADAGADEIYGGYVSPEWRSRYSLLASANHRYFANAQIAGRDELASIIKGAHRRGMKFCLTLNAPYYTQEQYDFLLMEAGRLIDAGVDAFIVSDLGLILRFRERLPEASVHLSTLGTVFNSRGAALFGNLGVKRIVFPRELTLKEMKGIIKANPGLEFDAFVMIGRCPNIEGFCTFTHNSPDLIWPCEESYEIKAAGGNLSVIPAKAGIQTLKDLGNIIEAQSAWSRVNRRQACGLCAVGGLRDAGVSALKLVGRGGPTKMKVAVLKAVKDALLIKDAGELREAGKRRYVELFGQPCSPQVCYYPELF